MRTILVFLTLLLFSKLSYGQEKNLDSLVTQWHKAAASANYDAYFGFMGANFVFLGTAPGERWNKSSFSAFSKPYFDRGKVWNFIPHNRSWMYSKDSTVAWFDEDLDTWMRGCRGSGVLQKSNGIWEIVYYNLTVLIENEKINSFIELRDKK
jgi:hypothetical protein